MVLSYSHMQLKNYYTTFFGMSQATAAWMLYIVSTDAYRSVACLTSYERTSIIKNKLKKIPRDIACIVLIIALFYCAYLPPLRVLLFGVDNYAFFLCNVPFENHWDFKTREVRNTIRFCSRRFTDCMRLYYILINVSMYFSPSGMV